MDATRTSFPQRATAVLLAKQYLVFFGIGLYALDAGVPLASAWLVHHAPMAELLEQSRGPLGDAAARPGIAVGLLLVAYLVLSTWLRAGYIRSIVGRFHLGPQDTRQYLRLLAFRLLVEVLTAGAAALAVGGGGLPLVAALALLAALLAVLYADYIIVIGATSPLRAIVASVRVVRLNARASLLVVLVLSLVSYAAAAALAQTVSGGIVAAMPLLVIAFMIVGALTFAADVVLILVYVTTVERDKLGDADLR